MSLRAVKLTNVSLGATEQDIKEFFSFSGEIEHVEMLSGNERSQIAYVTFKDPQGAETAVLLSGATIVDQSVTIALAPDYKLLAATVPSTGTGNRDAGDSGSAIQKAEDVVSSMLAKGFILGKDAVHKAKAFDEKLQFTSTAAAAEQTVTTAGSAIMKNRYVLTGASWVAGAFSRVAKAAGDVGQKTIEKVSAEEEQGRKAEGYEQVHGGESPKAAGSGNEQPSKPPPAQGLIL